MQQSDIITEYLDALTRELNFDVRLSHRVRKEVYDHLLESIANRDDVCPEDAQRSAIRGFGDPRAIALQYVAASVFAQTRRLVYIASSALLGIYIAMKGRGAWFEMTQWRVSEGLKTTIAPWIGVDFHAYRIALVIGIVGIGYIASSRPPALFHEAYGRRVRRCIVFAALTAVPLLTCVVIDTLLTAFRIFEAKFSAAAVIPGLSVIFELVVIAMLGLQILTAIRRIVRASARMQR